MCRVWNLKTETPPAGAVYCGRGSPYGNPFKIGEHGTRKQVIDQFNQHILPSLDVSALAGKDLVCFCKPKACHCDEILIKANTPTLEI